MIIVHLSHGLALISSCADRREAISDKELSSSRFNFLFSRKTLPSNLSWLQRAFSNSATHKERPSGDESSLTLESESEMCRDNLPMRQRPVKSLVLLGAGGVIAREVKVAEGCTCSGHHLLELLLLLVPEAVLLLALGLVTGVIPVIVVVLVGGVELLPLGAVSHEVGGVAALEAAPRRPPPHLVESVQRMELHRQ
jgi:hypothetical protein